MKAAPPPRVAGLLREGAAAALALLLSGSAYGLTAPEIEDGAELARRAAGSALQGSPELFARLLDVDRILASRFGAEPWSRLSSRQKKELRAIVLERFLQTIAPPRADAGRVLWSWAQPAEANRLVVDLGLSAGENTVKTRWLLERFRGGWRLEDVGLADQGISLGQSAAESLRGSLRRSDRRRRAQEAALPRLLGLAAIAAVVLLVARRLAHPRRRLLLLTAAAPALLFALDGALAVRRALSEPYTLLAVPAREAWRREDDLARTALREGRREEADAHWARALALRAPAGAIDYQRGLAARDAGRPEAARAAFERALSAKHPAPGAGRALAEMALAQGRPAEARERLVEYLRRAGPDPHSLFLLAVTESNLGNAPGALAAVTAGRRMTEEGSAGAEIEAQVRARTGDARGAIAALRTLEADGRLDRQRLRSSPAYLPIATDPAWVAFLAEAPTPSR